MPCRPDKVNPGKVHEILILSMDHMAIKLFYNIKFYTMFKYDLSNYEEKIHNLLRIDKEIARIIENFISLWEYIIHLQKIILLFNKE